MFSDNYGYTERPASIILGRRGFLKVTAACVGTLAVCGYALFDWIERRGVIIRDRQSGIYLDGRECEKMGLDASYQNPSVMQVYKDLDARPCDKVMDEILHTHYVNRSLLASITEELKNG